MIRLLIRARAPIDLSAMVAAFPTDEIAHSAVWARLAKDEAVHARFGWIFMDWVRPLLTPSERDEVARTTERALRHVDAIDDKVKSLEPDAFVDVGVFGACGREAYLRETRTILEERVIARLQRWS